MTDEMTSAKFNANIAVSVDGDAADFVSAIASAPELLHPNTSYYAHLYEIVGSTGTAIGKLMFTTENFPATFPTTRGTYSSFYNQITTASTSPTIEYKASERYLVSLRFHYSNSVGTPYVFTLGTSGSYEVVGTTKFNRPITSPSLNILYYDLYNITASGPSTSIALWDVLIRSNSNLSGLIKIDINFSGDEFLIYNNKKTVLVTE